MKIEKLELKYLCGYLPYGLKIKCADTGEIMQMGGLSGENTIEAVTTINGEEFARLLAIDKSEDAEEYAIPFLRPLSHLTQEITHNGETFVPLVGLFNLRYAPGAYEIQCRKSDGHMHDIEVWWDKAKTSQSLFYYNSNDMCFGLLERSVHQRLPYQFQMFQKLHEWHFDLYGLIESGLALELTNPLQTKQ